jgi:hypothetical protein
LIDNTAKVIVSVDDGNFGATAYPSVGLLYRENGDDNESCLIDKAGNIIVPFGKYFIWNCVDDLLTVGDAGPLSRGVKHDIIDISENAVVPLEYDNIFRFSENLAAVQKYGKWGILEYVGS